MKTLNHYMDKQTSKLYDKYGVFYAFGKDQIKEKSVPGQKYFYTPAGLFCPKQHWDDFNKEFTLIFDKAIAQQIEDFGAEKIISHEYFNHESQLSGDTEEARAALGCHIDARPDLFTDKLIKTTFNKCFQQALDNDWF